MSDDDVTRIDVRAERPYEVVVGHGLLGELPALLREHCRRVAVIAPAALAATAEAVREDLVASGFEAIALEVPDGEEAKTPEVAAFCWGVLGQAGFTRTDAVVAIGGGSTTDLAGFVANLIPVTLGNIVGGAVCVALAYHVIYRRGATRT